MIIVATLARGTCACLLASAALTATLSSQDAGSRTTPPVTSSELERWRKELSNWGRWGADDELGALNLITPKKRLQAAALVKEGFSVSLAREADYEKNADTEVGIPGTGLYERHMATPTIDWFSLRYHGYAHTHLDSLGHGADQGQSYNGYAADKEQVMQRGLAKQSIMVARHGIFTRGILMDFPRLKGVPYLEPDVRIYPSDLEAWERTAGVKVSAGDALFIRTGRWARRAQVGAWDVRKQAAGLDASVIPWLRQRDIAILAGEAPQDATPAGADLKGLPVHGFALKYLGVHLLDNVSLDAVAEAAAARKRWAFLVTAAPLPMTGGTGSPINPIATF
jgi:kynurenine formamidase